MRRLLVVAGVSLWALEAHAQAGAVERARAQLDDLAYERALKIADSGLDADGNGRETLLQLYEIEAVCWANLGKPAKATDAFKRLLALAPDFALSTDNPPRVRTPFYEAKEWVDRHGALTPKLAAAPVRDGRVTSLAFVLGRDPLKLLRSVRLSVTPEGGTETTSSPKGHAFEVPVGAESVKYRLELIGAKSAVLATLTGEVKAERVLPAPEPAHPPPALAESVETAPPRWRLPTALILAIAGATALGVGSFFGVRATDARSRLASVMLDADGAAVGVTQVEARELDSRATTGAVIADALMIGGAVIAAVGVLLLVIDVASGPETSEAQVVIAPAPGGAIIRARF